ncbi:MAG: wax ester/triacylglycerol synthase family O-acyltransferase [Ketobacteraceae bacterium]|nr:wax ester/triacylglycerol synthase family O-acyltransferase [Ketobacteraceae bacterium]
MERLSGLDASFLYAETHTMLMHVAFVAICDASENPEGYDFRDIYALLDAKTQEEPAFRRRLVPVPFNLHHPLWVDDPEFRVADHIHQYTLPRGSDSSGLGHKIGRIMSVPLDRRRPLWEAWVIEGLPGKRFALVLKIHHAMVDGVSGTDLFRHLFSTRQGFQAPVVQHRSPGERLPGTAELIVNALRSKIKTPKRFFNVMGDSLEGLRNLLSESGQRDLERSRPLTAPRTHFNRRISANRDLALAQLSLEEIKGVKNATGTTVNDVILAVCGGALKRYLEMQQDLPDKPLVAMVPISVRKNADQMVTNNQVSGMWSTLATHANDPLDRLHLIHKDTRDAKTEHDAVGADLLQNWAEFNTPGAFNLAMRVYASTLVDHINPVHNTIISNVPGPREPLYLCGWPVECMCPVGPVLEGVGLNISLASYRDCVGFTLHADSHLIRDVQTIAALIGPAFEELKTRAGTGDKIRIPRLRKHRNESGSPQGKLVKAS